VGPLERCYRPRTRGPRLDGVRRDDHRRHGARALVQWGVAHADVERSNALVGLWEAAAEEAAR
jgi:hypothetical protein